MVGPAKPNGCAGLEWSRFLFFFVVPAVNRRRAVRSVLYGAPLFGTVFVCFYKEAPSPTIHQ